MYTSFNDTTIISKFIKDLLNTEYIPLVQFWKPGDYVISGMNYITKDNVLRAIKSYNKSSEENGISPPSGEYDREYFQVTQTYLRDRFTRGINTIFTSSESYYDKDTHYYLGQYLRMLRDFDNLDLMPYYNCWNGETSEKIRLTNKATVATYNGSSTSTISYKCTAEVKKSTEIQDDGLVTLLVPINFNQDYTIYIDSNYPVWMSTICYDGVSRVGSYQFNTQKYGSMSYNNPVSYKVVPTDSADEKDISLAQMYYRHYVTLVIELPKLYANRVVVLEGDYTKCKLNITDNKLRGTKKIFSYDKSAAASEKEDYDEGYEAFLETYFDVFSSLTKTVNSNKTYAFSDRLVEFLLLNVIHHDDEISQNIERVQKYISSDIFYSQYKDNYTKAYSKGIWDENIRKYIYDLVMNKSGSNRYDNIIYDIAGYVDKDTEKMITKGQNV